MREKSQSTNIVYGEEPVVRAEWYKSVGEGTQGWLKQRWAGEPIHRQSLAMNPDMSGQLHDENNMVMRMICFMSDVRGRCERQPETR